MSLDIWLTTKDLDGNEIEVYEGNFTHNVTSMWKQAGCYNALYNSEGKEAKEIRNDIHNAVKLMEGHPETYKSMNSPNGWGLYKHALPWLKELLEAVEKYPSARIGIWK